MSGSTKFGDVAAANLAVGKSLTVAGTTQFGDLAAANLAVGKSLTVAGATQFGDLAAANLAVSKGLTVAGSTQLGESGWCGTSMGATVQHALMSLCPGWPQCGACRADWRRRQRQQQQQHHHHQDCCLTGLPTAGRKQRANRLSLLDALTCTVCREHGGEGRDPDPHHDCLFQRRW